MFRVERAKLSPHHCAVFPHLGQAHRDGYFDSGIDLPGPGLPPHNALHRMYVSVVAVKELARKLDWIPPEEVEVLRQEVRDLQGQLVEALERADAAEAVVDSIDVIESAAFRARKRPGRKAQEKAVV